MSGTTSSHFNTRELHREYGPAPWWDEERLHKLVHDEGLNADDIATVWNVHASTIDEWIADYDIRGRSV